MNIILITRKGRSRRNLEVSTATQYVLVSVIVLFSAMFCAGLGYWYGASNQSDSYVLAWQSELEEQRLALLDVRENAEARVKALTTRIGQMQGHITRLDALGTKLVKMAKIDEKEFEFNNPPGLGGPNENPLDTNDQSTLDQAITSLGQELGYREYQLFVLEEVLRSRILHEEVHPAGRPVKKGWISSYYGYRTSPFDGRRVFHKGLDIAGKQGSSIIAVAGGVVTWADQRWGYGNLLEINHGNGYSTRYGHCLEILVKEGEAVKKGQIVATMGSTGRSTGPHVHFEVLQDGQQVNPLDFIYAAN
ncbi:MAG: peptidoglycan DD-metalloendopeptidase family protein [Gammaproteobacteria bacterium]|nr:peptidoglycan DD-metalloendopeptidase family protein [Gammaproteobacteria bacterium]